MTEEEVDQYLNQVAFSSAEEFLAKYKGQNEANIIGHFGLGFYSAFMVSSEVEVVSLIVQGKCTAGKMGHATEARNIVLETTDKETRGTDIVLHINEESEEFLEEHRIESILEKFCRFLPVPIYFKDKQVNNPNPAWKKKPSELTTQDYQDFYKELYRLQ